MKEGLVDWDCAESLNIPDMEKALAHIRAQGTFPVSNSPSWARRESHGAVYPGPSDLTNPLTHSSQPDVDSKEDQNSVGECPVSDAKIEAMTAKVQDWVQVGQPGHGVLEQSKLRLCLLDGFLLYTPKMAGVMSSLDIKLFLLVSRAKATQRREARDGYVTLEGFWKDPPGYVDKIVWPNYAEEHKWLFEDGNVEGKIKTDVLADTGIQTQLGKGLDIDMETTLEWAVETIMESLEKYREQ